MKRREFITLLGGAAATWPLAAQAQQTEKKRRIGVLMSFAESDASARSMFTGLRRRLGELSLTAKIPAICQWRNMVEAGCLASYGITTEKLYSLSADQVAKLLKGAKPADLPVQQPTKFELVISLKSAKALGVVIPSSFLLRADEVFE